MNLKSQLESLLFVSLKPLSAKDLAVACQSSAEEVSAALKELAADYSSAERGLVLVDNAGRYQLATTGENAEMIQAFLKDETSGELSQPSLETLTIIAYRGPLSKGQLERLRGVNCSLIIRNLLLRGLIEEKFDRRRQENLYTVTHDFVRFLGLDNLEQLPDYERLSRDAAVSEVLAAVLPREEGLEE